MTNRRTFKEFEKYLKEVYNKAIKDRDSTRGTGVYLDENIGDYYMDVGEILCLQRIADFFHVQLPLYDPFETEEDDNGFNYCNAIGSIGKIK